METPFTPTAKPTIEDVRRRFEQWRQSRKHRMPIPESLWEGAIGLCADHSIYRISRTLRLDYNALKRRVGCSRPDFLAAPVLSSAFFELDLQASPAEAECLVEMEDKTGASRRLHIKGRVCLDPLELVKAFLGSGR